MNFKKSLMIALLSLGVVNAGFAGAMEDISPELAEAINYYDNGDYKKAFPLIKKMVENQSTYIDFEEVAQSYLGVMYEEGKGVKQDLKKAIYWYQKAAAENDTEALYRLGNMYLVGKGVKKDIGKAKKYFQRSCEPFVYDDNKYCEAAKKLSK